MRAGSTYATAPSSPCSAAAASRRTCSATASFTPSRRPAAFRTEHPYDKFLLRLRDDQSTLQDRVTQESMAMPLSPQDASAALDDIARVEARSATLRSYQGAAPYLILWGVLWAVGY